MKHGLKILTWVLITVLLVLIGLFLAYNGAVKHFFEKEITGNLRKRLIRQEIDERLANSLINTPSPKAQPNYQESNSPSVYGNDWVRTSIASKASGYTVELDHPSNWHLWTYLEETSLLSKVCRENICLRFTIDRILGGNGNPENHPDFQVYNKGKSDPVIERESVTIGGKKSIYVYTQDNSNRQISFARYYIASKSAIYKLTYSEYDNNSNKYVIKTNWVFNQDLDKVIISLNVD